MVILSTATFDEFDFPNCPREKLQGKPPPPEIQSPETSDTGDLDQGGDDDLQPPDQDQPETPPPRTKSHHGPPNVDTEKDDEDLSLWTAYIYAYRQGLPCPPNPQGGTLTGGARQRSPPAPIVPPRPPKPPRPLLPPRMGYGKEHP